MTSSVGSRGAPWREQVAEALVGLGWSVKQAEEAVARVAETAAPDVAVSDLLRAALRELGPR
jgi:Holliday junction DNA helicase RuvA